MPFESPDFESITRGVFTPDELEVLAGFAQDVATTATTGPYTTEAITPSRQELLDTLYNVLDAHLQMHTNGQFDDISVHFSNAIAPVLDIRPDQEMLIRGPRSFEGEEGYEVLGEGQRIFGRFTTFFIDDWFDIPLMGGYEDVNPLEHRNEFGLFVIAAAAEIEYVDDTREPLGDVRIPLNHGHPELYRVLRQQ